MSILLKFLGASAALYLSLLLLLYLMQRSLIYHPARVSPVPPESAGLMFGRFHPVAVTAGDGLALNGWFVPGGARVCSSEDEYLEHLSEGQTLAIVFCGNAGHRGNRGDVLELLTQYDVDAFIFDYRGYGDNDGSPSEQALIGDAWAIWQHLVEEHHVAPERIVIFGESLGGGVATQLAAHACREGQVPGGLIVQASFSSLVETAGYHSPWLPVGWLLQDRFESSAVMPDVRCPYLHLHGTEDRIVPYHLGRRLFATAPGESARGVAKRFVELPGIGHNNIDRTRQSQYGRSLGEFFSQIP